MSDMTMDRFNAWLLDYGEAWRTGNPAAVTPLFAPDARYEETPFDPPMIGRRAIEQYWDEGANRAQRDVTFAFRVVAVRENTGTALWTASFIRVPSGIHVDLDGMLLAEFNADFECTTFREWWHRRERSTGIEPAPPAGGHPGTL